MEQCNTVTHYEVAVLVLNYLDSNGHKKTAQAFRREARLLLGDAGGTLPAGVKSLMELLNEFVALREADQRRRQLQTSNPVAQSLYSLLDFHAGLPAARCLPPAFYAAAQPPPAPAAEVAAAAQPSQQQQPQPALSPSPMIPVQGEDLSYPAMPQQQPHQHHHQQQQQQQQVENGGVGQHTPGRNAHRKGAPRKRRRLDLDAVAGSHYHHQQPRQPQQGVAQEPEHVLPIVGGAAEGAGPGLEGLRGIDLLNMPLDEEGLLSLLCDDDLQNRFASGLAQHITTAMTHQAPGSGDAGRGGEAGEDQLLMASIEDVLAELPTDPNMAQLLQQFVRLDGSGGGGGGSLLASPRSNSLPASPTPPAGGGGGVLPQQGAVVGRPASRQRRQQAQQGTQQRSGAGAEGMATVQQAQHDQPGTQLEPVQPASTEGAPEPPHPSLLRGGGAAASQQVQVLGGNEQAAQDLGSGGALQSSQRRQQQQQQQQQQGAGSCDAAPPSRPPTLQQPGSDAGGGGQQAGPAHQPALEPAVASGARAAAADVPAVPRGIEPQQAGSGSESTSTRAEAEAAEPQQPAAAGASAAPASGAAAAAQQQPQEQPRDSEQRHPAEAEQQRMGGDAEVGVRLDLSGKLREAGCAVDLANLGDVDALLDEMDF